VSNGERALQFWSVLVFAAREQKLVTYKMLEQMTGMVRQGAGDVLFYVYCYCKRHKLPLLNYLAISQEKGVPGDTCPGNLDDLPAQQARVFVFDWLAHGAPSADDFEAAKRAEKSAATATS